MLLSDLLLFFLIYFLSLAVFLLFHYIALRLFGAKNFLTYMMSIAVVSIFAASWLSYAFISRFFSSFAAYVLANVGGALSAIFTAGLYSFVGPITADRSIVAQMIMFLYNSERAYSREEIIQRFNSSLLLEKRYEECYRANILREDNGKIILTGKGKKIAKFYLLLLYGLNLSKRSQYKNYFQPDSENSKEKTAP